jgi:hypothetical protein
LIYLFIPSNGLNWLIANYNCCSTLAQDLPRALPELPETLDQAYEQILKSIDSANRDHAYHLLQCLTVAIRPLRVEELTQVLAVNSGAAGRAGITRVKSGWRTADQRQVMSVLSECSSLIWIDSQVVQLSHFSVKEFLTSERLANSRRGVSRYHVSFCSAHTTVAQACLSVLLSLDDWSNLGDFPLAQYAANHWDDHVRFKRVTSDPALSSAGVRGSKQSYPPRRGGVLRLTPTSRHSGPYLTNHLMYKS